MQIKIDSQNKLSSILNQIFEIEQKVKKIQEPNTIQKNLDKLKDGYQSVFQLSFENPIGEKYNETRTDCEASIAGQSAENLVITEVIKPIIRFKDNEGLSVIVQKALVIVSSNPAE